MSNQPLKWRSASATSPASSTSCNVRNKLFSPVFFPLVICRWPPPTPPVANEKMTRIHAMGSPQLAGCLWLRILGLTLRRVGHGDRNHPRRARDGHAMLPGRRLGLRLGPCREPVGGTLAWAVHLAQCRLCRASTACVLGRAARRTAGTPHRDRNGPGSSIATGTPTS